MAKFKYKFDSVKRVKEIYQKRTQKELADIRNAISKKIDDIEEIKKNIRKIKEFVSSQQKMKASDIKNELDYEDYLRLQIKNLVSEIALLREDEDVKRQELENKTKEKKIFDNLELKFLADFIKEEDKRDQIQSDEIGLRQYIKKIEK